MRPLNITWFHAMGLHGIRLAALVIYYLPVVINLSRFTALLKLEVLGASLEPESELQSCAFPRVRC